MKLNDLLKSKNMTKKQFKELEKSQRKQIQKELANINQVENIERQKILKLKYKEIYDKRMADTTDEEVYSSMYEHIADVFGPWLKRHDCSGKLKLVNKYLNKYSKSKEQKVRIIQFIEEHGGFCDCEFVLNCPSVMTHEK